MNEFRIVICGQSLPWRETLALAFGENNGFEVVASSPAEELIATAARLHPDVLLWRLEDELPEPVIECLNERSPFTLPVLLVDDLKSIDLFELVKSGLRGCLPSRLLPRQVVQAVELIVQAGMLCLPRPGPEFLGSHSQAGNQGALYALTGRERDILSLLGNNLSNQEIAANLCLSESTVKTHLRNIFHKLGVRNRTETLIIAMKAGLIYSQPGGGLELGFGPACINSPSRV